MAADGYSFQLFKRYIGEIDVNQRISTESPAADFLQQAGQVFFRHLPVDNFCAVYQLRHGYRRYAVQNPFYRNADRTGIGYVIGNVAAVVYAEIIKSGFLSANIIFKAIRTQSLGVPSTA